MQVVARSKADILAARGVKPTLSPNLNGELKLGGYAAWHTHTLSFACAHASFFKRCANSAAKTAGLSFLFSPPPAVLATVEALDVKRLLFIGVGCQVGRGTCCRRLCGSAVPCASFLQQAWSPLRCLRGMTHYALLRCSRAPPRLPAWGRRSRRCARLSRTWVWRSSTCWELIAQTMGPARWASPLMTGDGEASGPGAPALCASPAHLRGRASLASLPPALPLQSLNAARPG